MTWPDRLIIRGCSYVWPETFTEDGAAKDMTGLTATFRMRLSSTLVERDTDDATEFTWTTRSSGTGEWIWSIAQTAALTVGVYEGEIFRTDVGPTERSKMNEDDRNFAITVKDPATGSF